LSFLSDLPGVNPWAVSFQGPIEERNAYSLRL
jgi:hypothetical protein